MKNNRIVFGIVALAGIFALATRAAPQKSVTVEGYVLDSA